LGSRKIRVHHLIPGLLLIAFVLVVKTVTGDPVGATFLVFAVSILAAPFLVRDFEGKYDFYWLTLFFALGIIVAAITSRYLAIFPTIARFIRKLSISGITRHSGYFNDPNFYAAHITAAMSGILILFLSQQKKIRMAVSVVGLMLLAFCGFLSVSKSFLLIVACVVIMWFLTFLFQRGKLSVKITWIMTMLVGVAFLLSATVFTDLIDMMLVRFGGIESLSDLTTHRSELWMNYLREFDANPIVLFFGKGCSTDLLNGRGTHNTLLQIIYQLGIVGGVVLAAWGLTFIKTILEETKIRWDVLPQIIILLIGCVGPWMGLDYFFQDEFFLMPMFVCAGIRYMCQTQES
jgi:O-antigen ligase